MIAHFNPIYFLVHNFDVYRIDIKTQLNNHYSIHSALYFFNNLKIIFIPYLASSSLEAPIITIFPDENTKAEHFFTFKNTPGNFSGSYLL